MTYRRDLLDTRVVVRESTRTDTRIDPLRRHVRGDLAAADKIRPPSATPDGTTAAPEVVLVKSGFRQVAVRVREIVFLEAARNYVHLHLESGAVLKSRVPIDRLARHLGTERFLRIHRGRIVNVERIRAVSPLAGGRLRLTLLDGATIIVARDRRRVVLAEIGARVARGG